MRFEGKVGIVTGGAQGIGRAVALALAREGARVLVADVNAEGISRVAQEVEATGGQALAVRADVSRREDVEAMVRAAVDQLGGVDILVNNAGILRIRSALEHTEEDWDSVMAVNAKGTFLGSQAAARQMVKQGRGGRIVNVASVAGLVARYQELAYGTSKAAIIYMTRLFALELGQYGITVNTIAPGTTRTDIIAAAGEGGDPFGPRLKGDLGRWRTGIPLGRIMEPEDQARAVLFLASEEASGITGAVLPVDGGHTLP